MYNIPEYMYIKTHATYYAYLIHHIGGTYTQCIMASVNVTGLGWSLNWSILHAHSVRSITGLGADWVRMDDTIIHPTLHPFF